MQDDADFFLTQISHNYLSAEKLIIQQALFNQLNNLDYFDKYYLLSITNTICENVIEIIAKFMDYFYKSDAVSHNEALLI